MTEPSSYQSVGSTSSSLLDRVKANDQDAWRWLVKLYSPLVLFWCRRAGVRPDDRRDTFQEVFRAVAAHVGQFHRDQPGDSFRAWLRTITTNKVNDYFRRRSRQPDALGGSTAQRRLSEVPESEVLSVDDGTAATEEALLMRQALALIRPEFEERTWAAFWQTMFGGQSSSVAAEALGMTAAAVRQAKSRVMRRLREELGGG